MLQFVNQGNGHYRLMQIATAKVLDNAHNGPVGVLDTHPLADHLRRRGNAQPAAQLLVDNHLPACRVGRIEIPPRYQLNAENRQVVFVSRPDDGFECFGLRGGMVAERYGPVEARGRRVARQCNRAHARNALPPITQSGIFGITLLGQPNGQFALMQKSPVDLPHMAQLGSDHQNDNQK